VLNGDETGAILLLVIGISCLEIGCEWDRRVVFQLVEQPI
jgi:hypothetical protein